MATKDKTCMYDRKRTAREFLFSFSRGVQPPVAPRRAQRPFPLPSHHGQGAPLAPAIPFYHPYSRPSSTTAPSLTLHPAHEGNLGAAAARARGHAWDAGAHIAGV